MQLIQNMFEAAKNAGLSVAETAQIVRISRVALFNWKAKRTQPHPQFQRRLQALVVFLDKLQEMKKLPLSDDLTRAERKEKVAKLKELFGKYV